MADRSRLQVWVENRRKQFESDMAKNFGLNPEQIEKGWWLMAKHKLSFAETGLLMRGRMKLAEAIRVSGKRRNEDRKVASAVKGLGDYSHASPPVDSHTRIYRKAPGSFGSGK